jgi:hypothetical protein
MFPMPTHVRQSHMSNHKQSQCSHPGPHRTVPTWARTLGSRNSSYVAIMIMCDQSCVFQPIHSKASFATSITTLNDLPCFRTIRGENMALFCPTRLTLTFHENIAIQKLQTIPFVDRSRSHQTSLAHTLLFGLRSPSRPANIKQTCGYCVNYLQGCLFQLNQPYSYCESEFTVHRQCAWVSR